VTTPHIPFHDYLGLRVVRPGSPSRVEIDLGEHVRGAVAPIHGGVVASIVDIACGVALADGAFDPSTPTPVSTDLSVRFLRQPRSSPLAAEATVVHKGTRRALVECVVTDATGRIVARADGGFMLIKDFHT
jgi:uncharacterized protein (TIGR00369 family)